MATTHMRSGLTYLLAATSWPIVWNQRSVTGLSSLPLLLLLPFFVVPLPILQWLSLPCGVPIPALPIKMEGLSFIDWAEGREQGVTWSASIKTKATMIITLPADKTRMAIIWSSRVSTSRIGSTIVRREFIVTVRYTTMPNTYAAGEVDILEWLGEIIWD